MSAVPRPANRNGGSEHWNFSAQTRLMSSEPVIVVLLRGPLLLSYGVRAHYCPIMLVIFGEGVPFFNGGR